ncbi:hypothetical protein LguiA_018441 [Lonicera macranthoides]
MRTGGVTHASVTSYLLETVESNDLIAYDLIPEFVGRFPILVSLSALTEDQLIQVIYLLAMTFLVGANRAQKCTREAVLKDVSNEWSEVAFRGSALRLIDRKAISKNTGARGLWAILENTLMDAMYEIPDVRTGNDIIEGVVVDKEAIGAEGRECGAKILYGEGAQWCYRMSF